MAFRRTVLSMALGAGLALGSSMALAQKGETVKIAWIDALTGLTAATGQNQLKGFQFLAEQFSKSNPAGVKFEITSFDNKLSPQETVNALQAAIDQGVRYVAPRASSTGWSSVCVSSRSPAATASPTPAGRHTANRPNATPIRLSTRRTASRSSTTASSRTSSPSSAA